MSKLLRRFKFKRLSSGGPSSPEISPPLALSSNSLGFDGPAPSNLIIKSTFVEDQNTGETQDTPISVPPPSFAGATSPSQRNLARDDIAQGRQCPLAPETGTVDERSKPDGHFYDPDKRGYAPLHDGETTGTSNSTDGLRMGLASPQDVAGQRQSEEETIEGVRFKDDEKKHDDECEQDHGYNSPPHKCRSRKGPQRGRASMATFALACLSLFSTIGSAVWFITALVRPSWGMSISTRGTLQPSTATLVTALFAKLIETSFVAVFVAFVGQVLTQRAFDHRSRGTMLAEISMRSWVIQPGLVATNGSALKYAWRSYLGLLCLVATFAGMFYTTASDALVSPKLQFGKWEKKLYQSYDVASYANVDFAKSNCSTPVSSGDDPNSGDNCLAITFSGSSYQNLQTFLTAWRDYGRNSNNFESAPSKQSMAERPPVAAIVFDNTTVTAAWIAGEEHKEVGYKAGDRIINNVTLAMPHPGVFLAATHPVNGILQPGDLEGVGEYMIKASVVSPALNVLCASMSEDDLAPLIYTKWPNAKTNTTDVPGQRIGWKDWQDDVPRATEKEWLNRTAVDDVFLWGPKYARRPPVFKMVSDR